jgi:hypothetical protein
LAQEKKAEKPKYNQELATSLGADQYGMKPYTIVMLTTGSAKIDDKAKMGELMKGHMANIGKLADEGKIVVADLSSKRIKKTTAVCLFSTPNLRKKLSNG